MQPLYDPLAIQRRALDVEDYIDVIRRHQAWILGPALASLVISVVVAFLWPDTYVSQATIRVTPPQIPENLISMPMNVDMGQRISQMTQQITSRANLTNIINTYQLYPRERRRLPLEDVIEDMRAKAVGVQMLTPTTGIVPGSQRSLAFAVSFKYENRFTAQKVCQDLVTRFIDENLRERSGQVEVVSAFVKDQWEAKKRDLDAIEEQLAKFKSNNVGRTPEQQGSTISAITAIESRMSNINASLARLNQDRLLIESQININKDQLKQITTPSVENGPTVQKSERLLNLEREIQIGETRIQALREQYTDTHPDVKTSLANLQILKRERDKLQKEYEEAERQAAAGKKMVLRPEAAREARALEGTIQQLQARIEATKMEEESYKKALLEAERQARGMQGTLATMPSSEKEYEQLRLQAMLARRDYEEIDRMRARAEAAKELDNRKQTEKLEILDSASLPQNPTEPKRYMIILGGLFGGLVLGLCLAGAREMKDSTLKNLKDVRAYTQLTVLGCIPLLENDLVVRRRRRLALLAWITASLASVAIMGGSIAFYFASKN